MYDPVDDETRFEQLCTIAKTVVGNNRPVDPVRFQKYLPLVVRLHQDLHVIAKTATHNQTWLNLLDELIVTLRNADKMYYLTQMFTTPALPQDRALSPTKSSDNIPCYTLYSKLIAFYSSIGHGLPYEYIFNSRMADCATNNSGWDWVTHLDGYLHNPLYRKLEVLVSKYS